MNYDTVSIVKFPNFEDFEQVKSDILRMYRDLLNFSIYSFFLGEILKISKFNKFRILEN